VGVELAKKLAETVVARVCAKGHRERPNVHGLRTRAEVSRSEVEAAEDAVEILPRVSAGSKTTTQHTSHMDAVFFERISP
jgi:hypothetical protein